VDQVEPFQESALPWPSTAIQKDVVGHDTEVRPKEPPEESISSGADHEEPFQ
jgi:hypothetical protein